MSRLPQLRQDLADEQADLRGLLSGLTASAWTAPTPSAGWTVSDQVGHLAYFDRAARLAIEDPESFAAVRAGLLAHPETVDEVTLHREMPSQRLFDTWVEGADALIKAAGTLADGVRVAWIGPSMGAASFLTARLMENWAHGLDVADAVGADRRPTDRLRHIAQLGVITRSWTYLNRGLEVPPGQIAVRLQAPGGDTWSWGEPEIGSIDGPAEDFCMVVTQRRHVDDTGLRMVGESARDWMLKAQAFAGAPTDGPEVRR